ncbi:MAG: adenylate kinase family protein [Candidatus Bathyarchaeia archaeon]
MGEFKRVILVTGTPGVGKTVISRLLASRLNGLHVNLAELVKQEGLISGMDETRETLIADMGKVSERVQEIIRGCEEDVIVDGHYAADVVPAEEVHLVFVLRRHPVELKRFMEKRGFRNKKLWENLAAEILDVCLSDAVEACGADRICEINISGRSVEETVEDMILVLEGKRQCKVGTVDWLGRLDEQRQLQKFLKHF